MNKSIKVQPSPRVDLPHFNKLNGIDFLAFVQEMTEKHNGIISNATIDISEKFDGAGIRIGVNPRGKFFFESSRSGPIFKPGSFSEFNIAKNGRPTKFSEAYDHAFGLLRGDKRILEVIRNWQSLSAIVKVHGEMFMNELGTNNGTTTRFIATDYDNDKLGKIATFVFFFHINNEHSLGRFCGPPGINNQYNHYDYLIRDLAKLSTPDVRIYSSATKIEPIDIKSELLAFLSKMEQINDQYSDLEFQGKYGLIVEEQEELMKETREIISLKIQKNIPKGKMSRDAEGIVIRMENELSFKVINPKFTKEKKKEDKKWAETSE